MPQHAKDLDNSFNCSVSIGQYKCMGQLPSCVLLCQVSTRLVPIPWLALGRGSARTRTRFAQ